MKAMKIILCVVAFAVIILPVFGINIAFTDNSDSYVAAKNDVGGVVTVSDECERKYTLGWIFCGLSDMTSNLIDTLINDILLPMIQWRLIV